ncbi:MAG: glycoside hydrolase family 130 protein [Oscillospiraceae bacterium]|nr:glycoside hydrolase family 130 protein [Oscillospiraceae bacterium]
MNGKVLGGTSLPHMPWQEKPADCQEPVWRDTRNPVILRDQIPCANSIFNSAAVPFGDGFAGVFRVDDRARNMQLHAGFSKDGIHWDLAPERIEFVKTDPEIPDFQYGYDPRVCFIEDRWYVTWCNAIDWKPTIGMAYTFDFQTFYQTENAFLPFNRNGVLFPRKIGGSYMMLSRPSDSGHTPFGDIFLSQSPDLVYWGKHRHVMAPRKGWESTKIGAGPVPIETERGWLLFYHGVLTSCNGFVYSFGAALLDREEPWKVLRRGSEYLLSPQRDYECVGDVPNVTFPCAALTDADTGRIAIYYGCADTCTGLCYTTVDTILAWLDTDAQKSN